MKFIFSVLFVSAITFTLPLRAQNFAFSSWNEEFTRNVETRLVDSEYYLAVPVIVETPETFATYEYDTQQKVTVFLGRNDSEQMYRYDGCNVHGPNTDLGRGWYLSGCDYSVSRNRGSSFDSCDRWNDYCSIRWPLQPSDSIGLF